MQEWKEKWYRIKCVLGVLFVCMVVSMFCKNPMVKMQTVQATSVQGDLQVSRQVTVHQRTNIYYGEKKQLGVLGYEKAIGFTLYNGSRTETLNLADYFIVTPDGYLTAIKNKGAYYWIDVTLNQDWGVVIYHVLIYVRSLSTIPEGTIIHVGEKYSADIKLDSRFPYNVTYTSSAPDIAVVDENGIVTAQNKTGLVTITATVDYPNRDPLVITGTIRVTNPTLSRLTFAVADLKCIYVPIEGTVAESSAYLENPEGKYSFINIWEPKESGEDKIILKIYGYGIGTDTYKLKVDGVEFKITVISSEPELKEEIAVLKKGKKQFHIKNANKKYSVVTYKVDNPKIASVSSKGVVKAKKIGTTYVTINVNGKEMIAPIVVQKGKMYTVVKYAANQIGKAKYSQAKRMKKGYYDCSSLVWRSYNAAGINIGNTKWALNSDGFANYYYKKKGHFVGTHFKNTKKLKCGDILIWGSYVKGKAETIHAELYIGDGFSIGAGYSGVGIGWYKGDEFDIVVRPIASK